MNPLDQLPKHGSIPAVPTYDFRCGKCHVVFEQRHSILAVPDLQPCSNPKCPGTAKRCLSIGSAVNTQPCSSQYPYVSSRLPFGIPGEPSTGRLKKTVVQNKQHEKRLFAEHGYVRE